MLLNVFKLAVVFRVLKQIRDVNSLLHKIVAEHECLLQHQLVELLVDVVKLLRFAADHRFQRRDGLSKLKVLLLA